MYNKINPNYKYPPETLLSDSFFENHTKEFYDFFRDTLFLDSKPNTDHRKLVELEKAGKLKAVIAQNIDRLHQKTE